MASITTDSGNLGAVIHSRRQTGLRWDHYWYFPAPEGLTGIDLTCLIDQTSNLDGVIAMYKPGVDPETTLDTAGGVTSYEIRANSQKTARYFGFPEPGVYTIVMRGLYAYVSAEKFSKVEELHAKGSVATEYMNIFITKLHYASPPTPAQSQAASSLIKQFEQEGGSERLPTLAQLESGQPVAPDKAGQGKKGTFKTAKRTKLAAKSKTGLPLKGISSDKLKTRRSNKRRKGSESSYPADPGLANAQVVSERAQKETRRTRNHALLIMVISIFLLIMGISNFSNSWLEYGAMALVGAWGLFVLYQGQFRYKTGGLWRFWVALALLVALQFLLN